MKGKITLFFLGGIITVLLTGQINMTMGIVGGILYILIALIITFKLNKTQ